MQCFILSNFAHLAFQTHRNFWTRKIFWDPVYKFLPWFFPFFHIRLQTKFDEIRFTGTQKRVLTPKLDIGPPRSTLSIWAMFSNIFRCENPQYFAFSRNSQKKRYSVGSKKFKRQVQEMNLWPQNKYRSWLEISRKSWVRNFYQSPARSTPESFQIMRLRMNASKKPPRCFWSPGSCWSTKFCSHIFDGSHISA